MYQQDPQQQQYSGGHRPGETYKVSVTKVSNEKVTFSGDVSGTLTVPADDVSYFTVGSEYVLHIRPVVSDSASDSGT